MSSESDAEAGLSAGEKSGAFIPIRYSRREMRRIPPPLKWKNPSRSEANRFCENENREEEKREAEHTSEDESN